MTLNKSDMVQILHARLKRNLSVRKLQHEWYINAKKMSREYGDYAYTSSEAHKGKREEYKDNVKDCITALRYIDSGIAMKFKEKNYNSKG